MRRWGVQYPSYEKSCQVTSDQIKADIKAANEMTVDCAQNSNNGACVCSVDWTVESGNLGRPRDSEEREEDHLRARCSCSRSHLSSEGSTHATFSQPGGEESHSSHHVPKQTAKVEPSTKGHQGGVVSPTTSRDMFSSRPMTRACSRLCSVPLASGSGKDNETRQSSKTNKKTLNLMIPAIDTLHEWCINIFSES